MRGRGIQSRGESSCLRGRGSLRSAASLAPGMSGHEAAGGPSRLERLARAPALGPLGPDHSERTPAPLALPAELRPPERGKSKERGRKFSELDLQRNGKQRAKRHRGEKPRESRWADCCLRGCGAGEAGEAARLPGPPSLDLEATGAAARRDPRPGETRVARMDRVGVQERGGSARASCVRPGTRVRLSRRESTRRRQPVFAGPALEKTPHSARNFPPGVSVEESRGAEAVGNQRGSVVASVGPAGKI